MKKKILIAILGLLVIAGILAGTKFLQIRKMMSQSAGFSPPPETVTATDVRADAWEMLLTAVGSLSAVQGVMISAELPGKVVAIDFEPGSKVEAGELLIRQDTSSETAQLPGAEASVELTRKNLKRIQGLISDELVAEVELDNAQTAYRRAVAEAESLRATIAKKKIRAPFSGTLGIRQVNLGEFLDPGVPIVMLQALDSVYVDFLMPQQNLDRLRPGLTVRVTSSGFPGRTIRGRITTVNPKVEEETRNVRVQGVIDNPDGLLRPGMYVDVAVVLPELRDVLVIPVTSVLYAPYSDSVFVVEQAEPGTQESGSEQSGGKVLRQQFVRLGEKRGDFVEVLSGLEAGETIVTTGVFKLRNGQAVKIDNSLQPEFKLQPSPENK